jgi:hypothetical protein
MVGFTERDAPDERRAVERGAPKRQAKTAKSALGYALVHRDAHPEMAIMSDDGVSLTIEQLRDIVKFEENGGASKWAVQED